jgi:PAS domain S-box-containing protein
MGETLLNKIPAPVLIVNPSSGMVLMNRACESLFGTAVRSFSELKSCFAQADIFDFSENPVKRIATHLFAASGKPLLVHATLEQHGDEVTAVVHPVNFCIDLLFRDPNIREIVGDMPLGIIVKNVSQDKTIWVSPYLISKIGYSADEIANNPWQEFTYAEDIDKQESLFEMIRSSNRNSFTLDKRIVSKSGKMFWFNEYVKFFEHDDSNYQVILLRDISNEKENEIELLRAKQKVEEAERLKTAFLENMPHEIRTPLHAITGFTSLLSDPGLSLNERQEYVKFIQDSSNDILNLIDNIIEIAKLETNQIKPRKEKCYINSILDKLYNDFKIKQEIIEKDNVEIKMAKANSDPLYTIYTDAERLYQVLNHLLNNALKFTEKGEILFGYKMPQKGYVEFFVSDTGIGIPTDQRDIIFKKFGKSGNINTNKNRGSGLGLTLSKKIIELMDGQIEVDSVVGQGSTFRFTIPIETDNRINIAKPTILGEMNWSAKTILIAEDTESNYFFIEAFLERTNVNLLWAQDGNEAVQIFSENRDKINMVLMDIMMPEKDGFDATREIKAIDPDIPVVAQTALALPDDEEKCYAAGCDYVLIKPINSEDLIATIRRFIQ